MGQHDGAKKRSFGEGASLAQRSSGHLKLDFKRARDSKEHVEYTPGAAKRRARRSSTEAVKSEHARFFQSGGADGGGSLTIVPHSILGESLHTSGFVARNPEHSPLHESRLLVPGGAEPQSPPPPNACGSRGAGSSGSQSLGCGSGARLPKGCRALRAGVCLVDCVVSVQGLRHGPHRISRRHDGTAAFEDAHAFAPVAADILRQSGASVAAALRGAGGMAAQDPLKQVIPGDSSGALYRWLGLQVKMLTSGVFSEYTVQATS